MKWSRSLPFVFAISFLATGCEDLLEKDISGYGVILLTPPDGHVTSSNLIEFRWEEVPRALGYRFQLATPGFDQPVLYLHDSLITSNIFTLEVPPGDYQWRVRGENPNSETAYYTRNLTVTEASSLEDLTPILLFPSPGAVTNADSITFTWEDLNGAEDYRFELHSGEQPGTLIQAQIVDGTATGIGQLDEGTYTWGVQAQNPTSSSVFSYRTFSIDRTSPTAPVLTTPANGAIVPEGSVTFTWQSGADTHVIDMDSLFILNDGIEWAAINVMANSYTDSLTIGEYSWYVRTIDAAGNGTSSQERTFSVQ